MHYGTLAQGVKHFKVTEKETFWGSGSIYDQLPFSNIF